MIGIARLRDLGLDAMELEFVQRVSMGEKYARLVRQISLEKHVRLSAHAPYYINLNSRDPETIEASSARLLQAARATAWCGAHNVVFHAAYYHGDEPAVVHQRVKQYLLDLMGKLHAERLPVCLRPETAGRASQFGSLEEVLRLCSEIRDVKPCIDIGHLHARSGGMMNTYVDFTALLQQIQDYLGSSALQELHVHFQGMEYSDKGERRHLPLRESDARVQELMQAFVDWNVSGTVICESPLLEEDALLLQETYSKLVRVKA